MQAAEREAIAREKILEAFEIGCPNIVGNPYVPHWPHAPQARFLGMHTGQTSGRVFEALYGGAAGGGKSDALLMSLAQYAWKHGDFAGIAFRRTFADLALPGALMSRALEWWIPRGVHWQGDTKTFRFPSGATVSFAYLQHDQDHLRYQGAEFHQTCVVESTPVLMPDGSYKRAGSIRAGEKVQTLEGPRLVTRTWRPGVKQTARVTTPYGSSMVSIDHPILLAEGWVCLRELLSRGCPPAEATISASQEQYQDRRKLISCWSAGTQPDVSAALESLAGAFPLDPFGAPGGLGSAVEASCERRRVIPQLRRLSAPAVLYGPDLRSTGLREQQSPLDRVRGSGPAGSSAAGCRDGCSLDPCRCDGQSHAGRSVDPGRTPSPIDAGERSQTCAPLGGLANTHARNRKHPVEVLHPYTSRPLDLVAGVHLASVDMVLGGEAEVVDLSVESASHYIVSGLLVVRNCWDELTQFPLESQYAYVGLSRVRRREGCTIPLRTLSASNPGGPGHAWVQRKFIGGPNYVPARIDDNPSLDRESYIAGLRDLHPTVRAQLLDGDWRARDPGDYFRAEWFGPLLDPETDAVPRNEGAWVRWWDLAASESADAARTAGVLMVRLRSGVRAVVHAAAFRATPGKRDDAIVRQAAIDGRHVTVGIEIEGGSGGIAQFDALEKRLRADGYRVHGARPRVTKMVSEADERTIVVNPTALRGKEGRADPVASCLERGHQRRGECRDTGGPWWGQDMQRGFLEQRDGLRLFVGPWTQEYLDELEGFPGGNLVDLVDATSGAWAYLETHAPGASRPPVIHKHAERAEKPNVHPADRDEEKRGERWRP